MSQRKWLDTHVHVSDVGADGRRRPQLLEDILAVLDQADADLHFVISPDAQWNTLMKAEEGAALRAADFVNDLCWRSEGRLFGACYVNPHFLDVALEAMDLCFGERRFLILGEMLQYMLEYEMDSDAVEALVRRAVEYSVPVQVHISTSNASSAHSSSQGVKQLHDLFGIVQRVPEAQYILAHGVGMPDADPPVIDTYLDAIDREYGAWPDHFWLEIRDFNSPGVRSALARVPVSRIIAGTDWTTRIGPPFLPYGTIFGVTEAEGNPYPPTVSNMVSFLREAGASGESIDRIGYENAAGLLGVHRGAGC